jgi:hypothetical protein
MSKDEVNEKMRDLNEIQDELIALLSKVKDNYGEEPESKLFMQNLKGASDQVHKIRIRFASGEINTVTTEAGDVIGIK